MAAQAQKGTSLGFPPKGSLKRVPFPRLVREIAKRKLTGSLYLLSEDMKKVVFFEEGQPVFVRSNVLAECLGQILAGEGLITQEQCEQTLEAIRRTGKKQGELLVEMGILSEGNLRYGLEAQLRYKLFDIFSWTDGRFQFKQGTEDQVFGLRLATNAEGVIVAAIQERFGESRAKTALDEVAERYPSRANGVDLSGLDLLPEEEFFVRCLDGSRSVKEVLDDPPEPAPPTTASLLYGVIQAGAVTLVREKQRAKKRPGAPDLVSDLVDDSAFVPEFEAATTVTEYEDTPLPGQLPSAPELLGDHEDDFASVAEEDSVVLGSDSVENIIAAEEGLQDEIEFLEDDVELEILEDEDLGVVEDSYLGGDSLELSLEHDEEDLGGLDDDLPDLEGLDDDVAAVEAIGPDDSLGSAADLTDLTVDDDLALDDGGAAGGADDDLMDLDDLDDIDLGDDAAAQPAAAANPSNAAATDEDPEILAAMRFNEGESALDAGDFAAAVEALESAYEHGFDVAELHAMLAYARFMASGQDPELAQHAFELLDYAEEINPNLDIIHAYRGAVLRAIGEPAKARAALERALQINPYCELAIETMDSLG